MAPIAGALHVIKRGHTIVVNSLRAFFLNVVTCKLRFATELQLASLLANGSS
jgi:hypothetical protein